MHILLLLLRIMSRGINLDKDDNANLVLTAHEEAHEGCLNFQCIHARQL